MDSMDSTRTEVCDSDSYLLAPLARPPPMNCPTGMKVCTTLPCLLAHEKTQTRLQPRLGKISRTSLKIASDG